MIKAILMKTNGTRQMIEFEENKSLETLQKLVGGLIEVIFIIGEADEKKGDYTNGRDLIINEEGLLLDLPVNPWSSMVTEGTCWYGQKFRGDIVLIKGVLR